MSGKTRIGHEDLGRPDLPLAEVHRPCGAAADEKDRFENLQITMDCSLRQPCVTCQVGHVEQAGVPGRDQAEQTWQFGCAR